MSYLEFLSPLNEELVSFAGSLHPQKIGGKIKLHSEVSGCPDLDEVKIVLIGVLEDRLAERQNEEGLDFSKLRKAFYSLFSGNWHHQIADLGDIKPGASVEDTYFALQNLVSNLIQKRIIPIVLGGSQDLLYAQYRAYDNFDQMVNLVNVDSKFDLGDVEQQISNRSYVGKMVMNQPFNLFNYAVIGYQSYFNSQDEIDLMEKLYFDTYRLGEVTSNINAMEPIFRNADIVAFDMGAVKNAVLDNEQLVSPNGFDEREICSLARYAGISDKVTSFGIFEYQDVKYGFSAQMLISQVMWYIIEGINFRTNENTISAKKEFIKYNVPIADEVLTFYKSSKTGRWWIEMPFMNILNNKKIRSTLLPCTQEDYIDACNQFIPERWYRAKKKNETL